MGIINVKNIRKEFLYYEHKQGFWGNIKNLFSRKYLSNIAVKGISFEISQGEIVGYLGANGAGKSTTIKMLTGILTPTSGEIDVMGIIPYVKRIENAKNIGAVFGQRTQLWWDIPLIESFKLNKYLYKIDDEEFNKRLEYLSEVLDLKDFINTPVRQLSLGQRMRGDLCMALLHNPKVLYLDEPTIGLDVVVKERIRDFIKKINEEHNTTVILTTHDMMDVEKLCTRVIAIDKGNIIYDGTVESLKEKYGRDEKVVFELGSGEVNEEELFVAGISELKKQDKKYIATYDRLKVQRSNFIKLINDLYEVVDIKIIEVDLESIVRRLYGKEKK